MSRAVADTSVFVAQEAGREPGALPEEIAVSAITAAELSRGPSPRHHDTWIAATAMRHGAVVVTQDADFSSFDEVPVVRV